MSQSYFEKGSDKYEKMDENFTCLFIMFVMFGLFRKLYVNQL